jgi:hypothetical protein
VEVLDSTEEFTDWLRKNDYGSRQGFPQGIKGLVEKLDSAEAELIRIGYHEVIDVVTENGGAFTSRRGDACWDTAGNRARVRKFYEAMQTKLVELIGFNGLIEFRKNSL